MSKATSGTSQKFRDEIDRLRKDRRALLDAACLAMEDLRKSHLGPARDSGIDKGCAYCVLNQIVNTCYEHDMAEPKAVVMACPDGAARAAGLPGWDADGREVAP